MDTMLPFIVALPLGAAFLLPWVERFGWGARISRFLALTVAAIILIMACNFLTTANTTYWMGGWSSASGALGISLVLDSLSRLMLVIVALITFASTVFSLRYMNRFSSEPLYYCLFFLMVAGMNGVVLAGDIFNIYVFLEVAAIASYALVAFGCGKEEIEASFKYLVLGSVGSVFILLGIGIVYNASGHLNMQQIAANLQAMNPAVLMAAAFFVIGFGLKAAMVPFHAWLPDAHPSAPAPISAMLSGVLIKALGVYTLIRVFFDCLGMTQQIAYILIALGTLSMILGGFLALGQLDFKRLLAYSSISQVGYVVLAVGVAGEMMTKGQLSVASLALLGGLFHLFNHAVFKSLLFLCSGATEYRTGTRLIKQLGGLKHRMPVTGSCLRVAALSISGIPPFNGFWSKLIIVLAVIQAGHPVLAAITVLVSFITLLYFIKVQRYILDGDPSEKVIPVKEAPWSMCLAMALLAFVCLGAGIGFPWIKDTLFEGMNSVLQQADPVIAQLTSGG